MYFERIDNRSEFCNGRIPYPFAVLVGRLESLTFRLLIQRHYNVAAVSDTSIQLPN